MCNDREKWQLLDSNLCLLSAYIDLNRLREVTGDDVFFIKTLLLKANEENLKEMTIAKELAGAGEWPGLAKTLHRLRGSAQVICANGIAADCLVLEKQCLAENNLDGIDQGLKNIETLLAGLNDCLLSLR
ncbi:TPA: Hpt domain-containing protein [Serratia fonticola]|uniref:Hpt domain-containing protein n=1 Tax=Serratia fonticola TaxID=47917 RepID=UPI0021770E25|nr:Hpt domain-containing protein [Serratia fonticola]CAI1724415.1 Uncharacterised protein [Serratia fonticola]